MTKVQVQLKNRQISLKEKFDDRYFTTPQAAEFLGIGLNGAWSVLKQLFDKGILTRLEGKGSGTTKQYKFIPPKTTLDDAAKVSKQLQSERVGAQPGLVTAAELNLAGPAAEQPINIEEIRKNAVLEYILATPSNYPPNIIELDHVKYVRMDKIAEVLLDKL